MDRRPSPDERLRAGLRLFLGGAARQCSIEELRQIRDVARAEIAWKEAPVGWPVPGDVVRNDERKVRVERKVERVWQNNERPFDTPDEIQVMYEDTSGRYQLRAPVPGVAIL